MISVKPYTVRHSVTTVRTVAIQLQSLHTQLTMKLGLWGLDQDRYAPDSLD